MTNIQNLAGKKVLLVGGAGFIGHNLALSLKQEGAIPTVIDGLSVNSIGYYTSNLSTNKNAGLYLSFINERIRLLHKNHIDIVSIDARDYHAVSKVVGEVLPDVVIHLAAVSHANRSNKDPFTTFDHSLRTLENVLDAIKGSGTHLIFMSSSMVYGDFEGETVKEDKVCNPLGIYGAMKYGAEKMIIAYNQVFDLPYTIVRPSALYGERCVSRRVGQAFIENALQKEELSINGDGNDSLDFTYISDLTKGIIKCIYVEDAKNETFNITYGSARSINDMADIVKSNFPEVIINHKPRDGLMPERGTLCIEKARHILDFTPDYPLEVGFINYINWYKSFMSDKEN